MSFSTTILWWMSCRFLGNRGHGPHWSWTLFGLRKQFIALGIFDWFKVSVMNLNFWSQTQICSRFRDFKALVYYPILFSNQVHIGPVCLYPCSQSNEHYVHYNLSTKAFNILTEVKIYHSAWENIFPRSQYSIAGAGFPPLSWAHCEGSILSARNFNALNVYWYQRYAAFYSSMHIYKGVFHVMTWKVNSLRCYMKSSEIIIKVTSKSRGSS